MKKLGIFAVLSLVLMLGYIFYDPAAPYVRNLMYYSTCDTAKTYRIGSIDERYSMPENEFLVHLEDAERVWEREWGGELFVYDPEGDIEVNLVYDRRSFLSGQIGELDSQLKAEEEELTPKIQAYQKKAEEFRSKISQLNTDIEYWNSQGGAPPEEFDRLIERQEALKAESETLIAEAEELNQSTAFFNQQVGVLEKTVNEFNDELSFKPEEGEYIYDNGDEIINIYFDNSETELVHTLAHEFGHAIRIEHNDNKFSVMYPQTNEVIELSSEDKKGLDEACREVHVARGGLEKLNLMGVQFKKWFATQLP